MLTKDIQVIYTLFGLVIISEERGLRCFTCFKAEDPSICGAITECEDSETPEYCGVQQYVIKYGHTHFDMGCVPVQVCQNFEQNMLPSPVGKRQQSDDVITCCDTDLCNSGTNTTDSGPTLVCEDTTDVPCDNTLVLPLICTNDDLKWKCRRSCGLCEVADITTTQMTRTTKWWHIPGK